MAEVQEIKIPKKLLPKDGRFGCGPALVPEPAISSLAKQAGKYIGNSHRQASVMELVKRLQDGCRQLFGLPDDYQVLLGNGGTTLFWDALSFCAIQTKSQHACFGEFSSKFAQVASLAPHLDEPEIITAPPGTCAAAAPNSEIDFYALTQNETSTGAAAQILRPEIPSDALVAVDATSGAGAMLWDPTQADIYYFSLQKGFASDGGLWVACCSPKAITRIQEICAKRWCPPSLNLSLNIESSAKHQTPNTPAVATLFMAVHYAEWALDQGGMEWAAARSSASSNLVYEWAESKEWAKPFVKNPQDRSPVVATIDLDESISAKQVSEVLRQNGILDTEPYRKLNRNQLRFGLFPARELSDVKALCASLDFVVGALA